MSRFYVRTAAELEGIDLEHDRLSYAEAAVYIGVSVDAVKQWKSRHGLDPAEWQGRRPLFRPIDVLRAEAKTRMTPQGRPRQAS